MDKDIIRGIIAEIEKEIEILYELKSELAEIKAEDSIILRRSIGSILHDFYNCCERIFKKAAEVRPAVITDELAAELDDYLSFRHVFRNIYGFELKGERISYLAGKFEKVSDMFIKEIKTFLVFLNKELEKN